QGRLLPGIAQKKENPLSCLLDVSSRVIEVGLVAGRCEPGLNGGGTYLDRARPGLRPARQHSWSRITCQHSPIRQKRTGQRCAVHGHGGVRPHTERSFHPAGVTCPNRSWYGGRVAEYQELVVR